MESFIINLAGFGFPDQYLDVPCVSSLEILKKGDVWRRKTEEKYKENIAILSITTTYEDGFGSVIDKIIGIIKNDGCLFEMFSSCGYLELQIVVSMGDNYRIPHIHISKNQMRFLLSMDADIDIQISA